MDLESTYNKIAEDWHRDHSKDTWWIEGTNRYIAFLKTGDNVLDVGCGAGTKSKYLIEKNLRVTGIDFSEKMIEIAKKEVPNGKFYVMDIYDLSSLHDNFEGIFAQAVLLHVPKLEIRIVMENLIRKLKKGGYFYIAVKEKRQGEMDEEVVTENDYGYSYERFFSYFTVGELREYFDKCKLNVCYESTVSSGKTSWIQMVGRL